MAEHLKGLIVAPFTPMQKERSLNTSLIPEYYQMLKSNKVAGAFISGSTGEGVSMTLDERKLMVKACADSTKNDKDFNVMTLLGGTCITDCIDLAKYAQQSSLYAVPFTAPFYFKPANAETPVACCKEIADVVPDMPFNYYHIPVLTGVEWRRTGDVRDSQKSLMRNLGINANLETYAGPGPWNDPDMLIVGLRVSKGPSSGNGGTG